MADARGWSGGEADLIQRFFLPLTASAPSSLQALGLQDDCAVISPQPGFDLVVTTDGLIEGVHFLAGETAGVIGWKALAVNVSDLIAKGANPRAYTMNLALPSAPTETWMQAFADGLGRAQQAFGCHLIGGDTDKTPGALTVSITALGEVPVGQTVQRSTAKPGDVVFVSGTIGDAALGLLFCKRDAEQKDCGLSSTDRTQLINAQRMPMPPVALALLLRRWASAAMDVSDGLIKDFASMCRASGVAGRLDLARMPLSKAAKQLTDRGHTTLAQLASGGEDYQVLFTVHQDESSDFRQQAERHSVSVTEIGQIGSIAPQAACDTRVEILDQNGQPLEVSTAGWDHFTSP